MTSLKTAAKETKTLLAQQENLLVLDYRAGTFFEPCSRMGSPYDKKPGLIGGWQVLSALRHTGHES